MQPNDLARLLAETPFSWQRPVPEGLVLTDIQWRADACNQGSILFFQCFEDGLSDDEIYRRYLSGRRFAALVTNRPLACFARLEESRIYVTRPDDWAEVVRRFCDLVYPLDPRVRFIGVTGTNGKTTTVNYLSAILRARGLRILTIGTLGVWRDGKRVAETGFTSPPLIELRRILYAEQERIDLVVMEASSHALDQGRIAGIRFQDAGWTNFGLDHLDYHGDEERYFAAKSRILDHIAPGGRLYCARPEVVQRLDALGRNPEITRVLLKPLNLPPEALAAKPFLALPHNRTNYALALALAGRELGFDPLAGEILAQRDDWRSLEPVPGRFECYGRDDRRFLIDFAHTPDALESILTAIRTAFPQHRLAVLFGCGGDRDRSKRPLMGAIAAGYADLIVLTSDNPRFEDPEQIIAEIQAGIAEHPDCQRIVDRAAAIAALFDRLAARPFSEPWVALIAGKGHEPYIDQNGVKRPYSDREEVERHLNRLGWAA
ncbi:UDP-N-acetylmuramoyl-L-alanyl-D-glutamate--2,6-diaminopimelate ligase [Caldichromatium japonicum]|uniref:UDP-N-acetylmuramoyl-L-alanyl-D-glutamate--2, 6-diaminopimelate ligase n=1 Tax=Caldichromatium japonicum TaxID=2699430 RepID=A0A6G7VCF8_9GAMM|nr:UDP-N-acetylmuramoyl-L-alanyl-D-glutamate--2,6-diaminopimelate ligase [Caldichromatium japonicum]QIK37538.1 UDP-N-acetylmuramoyl-L-alanyl-D-glutamate--2,6-diaminopimelate ligase [Caldichromatium japonicum]